MSEPEAPSFRLRVLPAGDEVVLPPGQTLLQAGLAAGVSLPRSCRNGTCRACMCRLLEGRIRYRIEWPGLLVEEKQEGWILPCVAVAESDVVITLDRSA
jgi:ferredoxin